LSIFLVIIAHQGDTLDYENLIPLKEQAEKISQKIGKEVQFIDDVAGPAARERIKNLKQGEILLLDNLRYLTEEVSIFEDYVKLSLGEMMHTYLVRNLAPLVDYYINDAFAAAHPVRNTLNLCPGNGTAKLVLLYFHRDESKSCRNNSTNPTYLFDL